MTDAIKTRATPLSFSSLTKFETCPKQFYHTKVVVDVTDTPGEQAVWGQVVHKHLEDRVRDGTPLPDALSHLEPIVEQVLSVEGDVIVEHQMAITEGFQPTGWNSDDAWFRGIVDVGVVNTNAGRAVLLDWKTGRRKPESTQLMLFAGLAFAHFPQVEQIITGFLWLKDGAVDRAVFTRENIPQIWQQFIQRARRVEAAFDSNKFPPKPSGLCARYCPVPNSLCQFSGKKHG